MKEAGWFIVLFIIFSSLQTAYAASSSVNIKNSINTSNSSTSISNCETDIRIESNGEVREHKSANCESVNLESSDGKSSVKINTTNSTPTPKPTNTTPSQITKTPTPTIIEDIQDEIDKTTQKAKEKFDNTTDKRNSFIKFIENFIRNMLTSIF